MGNQIPFLSASLWVALRETVQPTRCAHGAGTLQRKILTDRECPCPDEAPLTVCCLAEAAPKPPPAQSPALDEELEGAANGIPKKFSGYHLRERLDHWYFDGDQSQMTLV